jgi:hypothetical protein
MRIEPIRGVSPHGNGFGRRQDDNRKKPQCDASTKKRFGAFLAGEETIFSAPGEITQCLVYGSVISDRPPRYNPRIDITI